MRLKQSDEERKLKNREASKRWKRKKLLEDPGYARRVNQKWVNANRDKSRELWRKSYAKNRPNKLIAAKIKREKHRDYYRDLAKAWRLANPERSKSLINAWRKTNKDQVRALNRAYRSRKYNANGTASSEEILNRVLFYGGCCVYCNGPFESIDHAIPLSRGGTHWPANLYPACTSCNSRKRDRTYLEFKALLKEESTNLHMLI